MKHRSSFWPLVAVLMLSTHIATAQPTSFRDDFSSTSLDTAWLVKPGIGSYSLSDRPGFLRYTLAGSTHGMGDEAPLWISRPFTGTNWTLETRVSYNLPYGSGRQFYIRVPLGDLAQRGVNEVLLFRTSDQAGGDPLAGRIFVDISDGGNWARVEPIPINAADTYFVRVQRRSQEVSIQMSSDGSSWTTLIQHIFATQLGPLQNVLLTSSNYSGSGYADYDYVSLSANQTTSTAEIDTFNTTNVTQQVNAFQVELKARMQGGSYLFDQTYNVAFSDPTVQAAVVQARNLLTNAGAASFTGPTQLSSTQSTNSVTNTVQTGRQPQTVVTVAHTYVGPQTIYVGDHGICQSYISGTATIAPQLTGCSLSGQALPLLAGQSIIDTLTISPYTISQTSTTTNTTLTSQVYEIEGVASGTPSCSYAISTPDLAVPAAGGTMALSIHSDSGCSWSISGLPSWLTVSGNSQGTGSADVTLAATANSGGPRNALVSVGGVSVPVRQLDSSACAGSVSCTVHVLTHVAFGGPWTTDLVAIGSGTNAGSFSVGFRGDNGAAVSMPFTGGLGDMSTLADSVPAQGRKDYSVANPALSDQGGWGLVTGDDSLTIQAVFRRHTPDGKFYEAAVPTSGGYSRFIVPFDATTFAPTGAEMFTGLVIDNLNPSATAHIACTARDQAGVVVPNAVSIPALNPLGHYTGFAFPALAGKRGTFDCSADTLVSAVALRAIGGDAISTLPVIPK